MLLEMLHKLLSGNCVLGTGEVPAKRKSSYNSSSNMASIHHVFILPVFLLIERRVPLTSFDDLFSSTFSHFVSVEISKIRVISLRLNYRNGLRVYRRPLLWMVHTTGPTTDDPRSNQQLSSLICFKII